VGVLVLGFAAQDLFSGDIAVQETNDR